MKKVLAILLLLTMCTFPVAAGASDAGKSDLAFLKAVGILEDDFTPSAEYVTRGEAAMILANCLGKGVKAEEIVFSDVSPEHTYAGEIAAAYKAGLVSGFGDGSFRPAERVTFNQMVKMLVVLLGYEYQAQAAGGYPSGYLTVAVQKEVIKSGGSGGENPLGTLEMEKLVRAALDVPLAEGTVYEEGYVKYTETGATVLSAWHGIDRIRGTVTADFLASFAANRAVRRGEVAIDGNVYSVGETDAASFLCRRVDAYIDREAETIRFIEARSENDVLQIPAADIIEVTAGKIRYKTESGEETAQLESAALVKNGARINPWTPADLYFENGMVKLVSAGGTGYAFIVAEQYVNRIVDYINLAEKEVVFKDGTRLVIDTENGSKTVFLETNGKAADLAYSYPWDVFSVMESTEALKVIRSEKFVLGTVEEISDKGLVIDGTEYEFAPGFLADTALDKPELDMYAGFNFDYTGRLAAINPGTTYAGNYGILTAGHQTQGLSSQSQLKIFTADAEMKGFEITDKVRFNGKTVSEEELFAADSPLLSGGTVMRQMVSYSVNQNGEISELDTAQDFSVRTDDEGRLEVFSRDLYINESRNAGYGDTIVYRDSNTEQFGGKYRVRSGTLVFVLPDEGAPDADYGMVTPQSLLGGSQAGQLNRVTLYDLDEFYNIAVMTWEKSEGGAEEPNQEHEKLFVSKVSNGLDADGMPAYIIEGWHEGGDYRRYTVEDGLESYFLKAYTDPAKEKPELIENGAPKNKVPATVVRPGDLIQIKASNSGHISWMNVVARGASLLDYEVNYDGYGAANDYKTPNIHGWAACYMVAAGTVKRAASDAVVVETKNHLNPAETFIRVFPDTGVNLLFDREKGTTEKISMNEIRPGDTVLNFATVQTQWFCIVYR